MISPENRQAARTELVAMLGPAGVIDDVEAMQPYVVDQRDRLHGRAPFVLRPSSTEEVAAAVKWCGDKGYAITPQGGNTGLVGGSVPDESGRQVVLSLGRMNRVRSIDALNFAMVVEAGCILSSLQNAADEVGLLFPLSLGAEGSCQIGGNLSTNAGGTAVLRYGNARDLVMGLEVVLADGTIWNGLRTLRKDNTGYDLKQLFLGAEGTLGVITAAALKLYPKPSERLTAFAAVQDANAATRLLARLRDRHGDAVTTFEYMDRLCVEMVLRHIEGTRNPLATLYEHHVLIELSLFGRAENEREDLEMALGEAMQEGDLLDAAIADSGPQADNMWRIRENIPEATKLDGAGIKHDISVALTRVPEFLERGRKAVSDAMPEAYVVAFGHLGDGNLHFNLNQPPSMDAQAFLARTAELNRIVHDLSVDMNGSFSAEHGIGRNKRGDVERYKDPVTMALMRKVKQALDPDGRLNPGIIL